MAYNFHALWQPEIQKKKFKKMEKKKGKYNTLLKCTKTRHSQWYINI